MKTLQGGFVWLPILLTLLGILAVSGGAYLYVQNHHKPISTDPSYSVPVESSARQPSGQLTVLSENYFSAMPTSGAAPLSVRFKMNGKGNGFKIFDFGDGAMFSMGTSSNYNNVSCTAAG